jgi:TetR/AcrR family transcriptional regulator, acrAB operon repressor
LVRRTREDALATRHRLLDAAEVVFHAQGVSRSSLSDIAQQAGTTRGAIYWHFKDKADLFNAMMERVTLPLEASFKQVGQDPATDSLAGIRKAMHDALVQTATDARTRRVFEVATHKVEYVDELQAVRQRHLTIRSECIAHIAHGLRLAATQRGLRLPIPVATAAQGLHALVDGLIQNWLLEPSTFNLVTAGVRALDTYLAGLGFAPRGKT